MELKRIGNLYGVIHPKESVMAACDAEYFMQHAAPFVYSLDAIGKNAHIHVVNPTKEVMSLAAILYGTTKVDVGFTFETIDFSKTTAEQQRTYYASFRFLTAPVFLPYFKKMLITDIDCVFVNKFNYPEEFLGYYPRESLPGTVGWEQEATKIAAGAVYYDERAQETCEKVVQAFTQLPFIWFVDQMALRVAFEHWPKEVVKHFDSKFMDWEFNEDSVMWTGKGDLKHNNEKYLAKKAEYNLVAEKLSKSKNIFLRPVLNIAFKNDMNRIAVIGGADTAPIRHHWRNLALKLLRGGNTVNVPNTEGGVDKYDVDDTINVMAPQWFFNPTILDYLQDDQKIFVPHHDIKTFTPTDAKYKNRVYYYMQTVFPWLFTIDPLGWGARGRFVRTFSNNRKYTDDAFNTLKEYIDNGGTKFEQPDNGYDNVSDLVGDNYIFVPLQIPHDKVIEFDSDITVPEYVKALCEWADEGEGKPKVVFKGHPVNPMSMVPLTQIIEQHDNVLYLTDVEIHSMIKNAKATYVINSGTGQEAMLQDAKVVSFGRSEYKDAVIGGDIADLDKVWSQVQNDNTEVRKKMYRRWYDWYLNDVVFDTTI